MTVGIGLIVMQAVAYIYGRVIINKHRKEEKDEKIEKIYDLINELFTLIMIVIWVTTEILCELIKAI